MWFFRWLFVSMYLCAGLGALQAALAMGETIERAEVKLMPLQTVPVERAGKWTPPAERLADVIDELRSIHGKELTWALLMREAARVKHEG